MSLDSSLKVKGALTRHRNVLTRAERIEKLKDEEKWEPGTSVLGLPKVSHRKVHAAKKEKEVWRRSAAAVPGAPAAAPAAGAAGAKAPGAAAHGREPKLLQQERKPQPLEQRNLQQKRKSPRKNNGIFRAGRSITGSFYCSIEYAHILQHGFDLTKK